ncbi:MAG TPA: carbohydrate ABC transporter permease, partial [Bacillota bacterium]|nr:carbohydrate ABC transporter permease [Bacillota bacterium]
MRNLTRALGYILLTVAALTFIYPFLWMASASLKPENEIGTLALISKNFSVRGYRAVFRQIPIARALFNSGLVSITATASVLVLSSMVGYALARLRFLGRDSILNLVLLTMMIPGQLLLIPMYILVVRLGWTDSYRALIIPAMISNMGIIVFRQFFRSLPQDLIDAARIDGCSDYRILFQIFWPLSKPV